MCYWNKWLGSRKHFKIIKINHIQSEENVMKKVLETLIVVMVIMRKNKVKELL